MLNTFSVITSVLNGEDHLEPTLKSVCDQNYPLIEYIVIDGNSSDRTLEIIHRYKDTITEIISEPDEGVYDAWNKGLERATGDWICFIGCGDLLTEHALSKYNNYIEKNPGLEFISAQIELIDAGGRPFRIVGSPWKWKVFNRYMNTLHVGCLHHKSLFGKYGNFNKDFKIAGDYELLLRAKKDLKAGFLDYPVVKMAAGGISVSNVSVFHEVEKAKRLHTNKPVHLIRIEKLFHIFKFYLKRFLQKYFGIRYF